MCIDLENKIDIDNVLTICCRGDSPPLWRIARLRKICLYKFIAKKIHKIYINKYTSICFDEILKLRAIRESPLRCKINISYISTPPLSQRLFNLVEK